MSRLKPQCSARARFCAASVAFLLSCSLTNSEAFGKHLLAGPYLRNPTPTSIEICWELKGSTQVQIRYLNSGIWTAASGKHISPKVECSIIEQLSSNSTYPYRFRVPIDKLSIRSRFKTAPSESESSVVRFAAVGDTGSENADERLVATRINQWRPEILLHLGDMAVDSQEKNPFEKRFFAYYLQILRYAPIISTLGNHDRRIFGKYLNFFQPPYSSSGSNSYYSFNYGQIHFTVLDSSVTLKVGTPQYLWLDHDLATSQADLNTKWRVILIHIPPFSDVKRRRAPKYSEILSNLAELRSVDLILSGDAHSYQRIGPINALGTSHSVLYIVSAGGGQQLRDRIKFSSHTKVYRKRFHFLGITATKDSLDGEAISGAGRVIDRWKIDKGQ